MKRRFLSGKLRKFPRQQDFSTKLFTKAVLFLSKLQEIVDNSGKQHGPAAQTGEKDVQGLKMRGNTTQGTHSDTVGNDLAFALFFDRFTCSSDYLFFLLFWGLLIRNGEGGGTLVDSAKPKSKTINAQKSFNVPI